jgi:hypothetical protein
MLSGNYNRDKAEVERKDDRGIRLRRLSRRGAL